MLKTLVIAACVAAVPFAVAATGQSAAPAPQAAPQPSATPPAASVSPQRALINQYCAGCHSQRAKTAGQEAARKLMLDDVDINHVAEHADIWETVVRKLRAGMMPPAGVRRPDKAAYAAAPIPDAPAAPCKPAEWQRGPLRVTMAATGAEPTTFDVVGAAALIEDGDSDQ